MKTSWGITAPDLTVGLLEEGVERLAGACRRRRLGFALDFGPRLEERAGVPGILRRDAGGNRLLALERRAGVEVEALGAGVHVGAAARALAVGAPRERHGQFVPARRAANDLAVPRHVEGLRRGRRLSARGVLFFGLRLVLAARLARIVLIATLPVLALVGHSVVPCRCRRRVRRIIYPVDTSR